MEAKRFGVGPLLDRMYGSASDLATRVLGGRGREVLIGAWQAELRGAILADIRDVVPILGDVANLLRVQDAARRGGDFPRKRIPAQLADLIVGVFPVVGDIGDLITPTNTLAWLEEHDVQPTDLGRIRQILGEEFAKR